MKYEDWLITRLEANQDLYNCVYLNLPLDDNNSNLTIEKEWIFISLWGSQYTIYINAEMNYYPLEVCNIAKITEPLINLINNLSQIRAITAKGMYLYDRWMTHHNTD